MCIQELESLRYVTYFLRSSTARQLDANVYPGTGKTTFGRQLGLQANVYPAT